MLKKHLSLSDCDLKIDEAAGKFSGYASVFGGLDSYGDTILRGAYEYTLRTHGKPKMFFNHRADELPIGRYHVTKEDDRGLYVEGELTPGLGMASDVRAAMKHGTLDGLSIGYIVKKGDYEELEDGRRIIKRVSRLFEVSPVMFPADESARIDLSSVKRDDVLNIDSIKDLERFLRDAGGFSKALAELLISKARDLLATGDPKQPDHTSELDKLVKRISSHQFPQFR